MFISSLTLRIRSQVFLVAISKKFILNFPLIFLKGKKVLYLSENRFDS